MAHIYMSFDFGTDEEKAQQARHKIEGWKQAFRLDKKLLYKFERPAEPEGDANEEHEEPAKKLDAKPAKSGKSAKAGKAGKKASTKQKAKADDDEEATEAAAGPVKLHLRLAFSGHEKMTEERWVKRIPGEEPFSEAQPQVLTPDDAGFADIEGKFDSLE